METLQSVVMEVQKTVHKCYVYKQEKCPFICMEYPVFESRGCGFCRVESSFGGIWTRDQRTNYCEFLKERDRFFFLSYAMVSDLG